MKKAPKESSLTSTFGSYMAAGIVIGTHLGFLVGMFGYNMGVAMLVGSSVGMFIGALFD